MSSRPPSSAPATLPVVLCLVGSGYCALAYQVTWLREFRLVFGSSTAATAAVLAVFMGGIGIGSVVLGSRADERPNPLRLYGRLEAWIAATAALTPLLLIAVRHAYISLGGTPALGIAWGTVLRLAASALVLLVPTFLMGGTLPAAIRALAPERDEGRKRAALAYGANALGAAAGILVPTFFLFESWGHRATLWSACALNVAVAAAALTIARSATSGSAASQKRRPTADAAPEDIDERGPWRAGRALVLAVAALSGFGFFLMELVWYRMLTPLLGGSTFTFGLILTLAVLGIAAGSLAWSAVGRNARATLPQLGLLCALEALFVALPLALGDRLAVLAIALRPLGALGFWAQVAAWSFVAAIVVLPFAILAGAQFPLLIALLGRGRASIGRHTGLAYAWNTGGAIVGSLAGGLALIPALGAPGAWRLVAILLAFSALAAIAVSLRGERRWSSLIAPAAVSAIALACLAATGPTAAWRHNPIATGPIAVTDKANDLRELLSYRRRNLLWEAEGVESSVAMMRSNGLAFLVNGKSDGNARHDAPTQVMLGVLPALIHPSPQSSLVIGLGTGSTAGWLAAVPGMRRVDVLELEPAVWHVARACSAVNHAALDDPKVRIHYGDAREILLAGRDRYDLIASEPSNPYRAGVASLFTVEFYRAVAARLEDHGLLAQWVQAYEIDGESVAGIYATLTEVFPEVETWRTQRGDLLFLAAREPIRYHAASLRRRIQEEPFRSALARIWRVTDLEGVFARYVANADLARGVRASGVAANTDDHNLLEFAVARTVGHSTGFTPQSLEETSMEHGFDRPPLTGEVDWTAVSERRTSALVLDGEEAPEAPEADEHSSLRTAAKRAFADEDFEVAYRLWKRQPQPPADLIEWLLVAQGAAAGGEETALECATRLEAVSPGEADAVRALYFIRVGRVDEALAAIERAVIAWRRDPWSSPIAMEAALSIAQSLGTMPQLRPWGERLCELLETPFQVFVLDARRTAVRFHVAQSLDDDDRPARVRDALAAMEPDVPWDREVLSARATCYALLGDPRAASARRDLEEFERGEARPLVVGNPLDARRATLYPAARPGSRLMSRKEGP